jgi:hypothetical protein
MKLSHTLFGTLVYLLSNNAFADAVQFSCEITAYGDFTTGESFSGNAVSEMTTGYVVVNWQHLAPGIEFVTDEADAACFRNGEINADIVGTGTGTLNGHPGYSFAIHLVDNRPAPLALLTASIVRSPTVHSDGVAVFDSAEMVTIPFEIPVKVGASGNGRAQLQLGDVICYYRGTGGAYEFQRCTDPLNSGYVPGISLNVGKARLRLLSADPNYDLTLVRINIGGVSPGDPDEYRIDITNGSSSYSFSGLVIDGDVSIPELD